MAYASWVQMMFSYIWHLQSSPKIEKTEVQRLKLEHEAQTYPNDSGIVTRIIVNHNPEK